MKTETSKLKQTVISKTASGKKRLRRKQRGVTLVTVVISLAMGIIATIAFLTQGVELANENKINIGINELSVDVGRYSALKTAAGGILTKAQFDVTEPNVAYNKSYVYTAATAGSGGNAGTAATLAYTTDSDAACKAIETVVGTIYGVSGVACNGLVATITLD